MLQNLLFIPSFTCFYHERVLGFVMSFFCSRGDDCVGFFSLCFINMAHYFDFLMLNQSCIPGINPAWSQCIIFLVYCWIQFARIILSISAFIFLRGIGLQCFIRSLYVVLISRQCWPQKMSWEILSPLLFFWKRLCGNDVICLVIIYQ